MKTELECEFFLKKDLHVFDKIKMHTNCFEKDSANSRKELVIFWLRATSFAVVLKITCLFLLFLLFNVLCSNCFLRSGSVCLQAFGSVCLFAGV